MTNMDVNAFTQAGRRLGEDQRNTRFSMNSRKDGFSYKMGPPPSDVCWFLNTMNMVISTTNQRIQQVICVNYLSGPFYAFL